MGQGPGNGASVDCVLVLFQTDRVSLGMNFHELSPHTHTHTVCSMTIWMGHLAKSVTQAQITQAFEDFGQVKSVDVSAL